MSSRSTLATYLLQIDRKTWTAFLARVRADGRTAKYVLARLIEQYIAKGLANSKD